MWGFLLGFLIFVLIGMSFFGSAWWAKEERVLADRRQQAITQKYERKIEEVQKELEICRRGD